MLLIEKKQQKTWVTSILPYADFVEEVTVHAFFCHVVTFCFVGTVANILDVVMNVGQELKAECMWLWEGLLPMNHKCITLSKITGLVTDTSNFGSYGLITFSI